MSWPLVKLETVSEFIRNGASIKQSNDAAGLPITRIETIADRTVNLDKCGYADLSEGEYLNYRLRNGDILISHINSEKHLAKCAIFESDRGDIVHGMNLLCLRPCCEVVFPKYLFHYLSSPVFLRLIPAITKKSVNQASFTVTAFKDLEIPLPPLPEQKRIAAILDKADAIRRKRQQAIQLADDFLRAVFLDMFGDPVTNPKGWPKRTLKLLGKSATGRTPPSEKADMWGEGLPFVTPGDLSGRVDSSVREVTQEGAEHSKVCRTGSLLVCCIGATIGKVGIAGCPVAFNQQINAQEWGADILDVYGYFVFKLFPDLVRERAIQTTLPILKKSLFDEIEIPVPLIGLQEKFSAIAQKVSESSLRHESGLNTPLFESLSQLAFSGQL
ncbi:restriction endonuclease subunit S [Pseudomonas aeruginosa]|uniref:restriction endonuclease subunit S n=1 Tax=Pseudomonas aeruginosa TaxID=287 RepID=UPI001ADC1508|nr:restriction endonuclease subunit S [Pseudomonas aeruginosa]